MNNANSVPYTQPQLEIIIFESADIVTSSGGGYVPDDNEDGYW